MGLQGAGEMIDSREQLRKAILTRVLYIPTYPKGLFCASLNNRRSHCEILEDKKSKYQVLITSVMDVTSYKCGSKSSDTIIIAMIF